jgi:glucosamine kinase
MNARQTIEGGAVLGIDGGGSKLRVLVADLSGRPIGYAEGASVKPFPSRAAALNGPPAIAEALRNAGTKPEDVTACVAGLAGLDHDDDQVWASDVTALPGLSCSRIHLNDAEVAHAGALLGRPGIVVISGGGAIVWARTERGRVVRNYDFGHYSATAARFLAFEAVFHVVAGEADDSDRDLLDSVLAHFGVTDSRQLAELASHNEASDKLATRRAYEAIAPLVTSSAENGSSLGRLVCNEAIDRLVMGVALVATAFERESIDVALVGGVTRSPYIARGIARRLAERPERDYRTVEATLSPAAGAVLLALERAGAAIDDAVVDRLRQQTA